MSGTKSLMQRLRGTEKVSMYPLSQFIRLNKSMPSKYLFERFTSVLLPIHKAPSPTLLMSEGREKEITTELVVRKPFKIRDEFSEFCPDNFKWKKLGRKITKIQGSKSNKLPNVNYSNTHRFKCYKSHVNKLPNSVFNTFMLMVLEGVFKNEYKFKMPDNLGEISASEIDSSMVIKPILRSMYLTPMDVNYRLSVVRLKFTARADRKIAYMQTTIIPTDTMRAYFRKQLLSKNPYNTYKIKTMRDLMPELQKIYKDVPRRLLLRIIQYGFKMLKRSIQLGFSIKFSKFKGFGKGGKKYFTGAYTSKSKYKTSKFGLRMHLKTISVAVSRKLKNQRYYGYHYCALSQYEHYHLSTHLVTKQLTRYMDEAMINPYKYPYIIAVKTEKTLNNKIIKRFKTKITYERGNIKYLWRWDGSRFRAVDNSKFRINVLSQWDHNYI